MAQISEDSFRLPNRPTLLERKQIGEALLSALQEWEDEDAALLRANLKGPEFKPITTAHYLGEWHLAKDGKKLMAGRILSNDLRIQYEIRFRCLAGNWKNVGGISKATVHRAQPK